MLYTDEQKKLAREYEEMTTKWLKDHKLECATCKNRTDKNKDKCTLKVYCIVKFGHGIMGYSPEK